jgi:hypothetical protein
MTKSGGAGRALRALQASTPAYDTEAGLARFSAALGATAVVGVAAGASATGASAAAATKAAAIPAAVTSKAAVAAVKVGLSLKLIVSSAVLVGGVGTAAVIVSADDAPVASVRSAPIASPRAALANHPSLLEPRERPAPVPTTATDETPAPAAEPTREDRVETKRAEPGEVARSAPPADPAPRAASVRAKAPSETRSHSDPRRAVSIPAASMLGQVASAASTPPPAVGSAQPAAQVDQLGSEMEHLASLRRAFDPAWALQLAEEGHATFPRGLFWQERESIAITSLTRLGRTAEARARARAFIEKHPNSPGVEELRRVLGE